MAGVYHATTATIADSADAEMGKTQWNAAHKQVLDDNSQVNPPTFGVDASNYTTGLADHTSGLIILSRPVDVRMLGAKCDGRYVADATITARTGAGNVTITSATIAFTSADVGKYWGLNSTGTTAAYAVYTGYIVSVESATSATCHSFNTTLTIASGAGLVVATDDSTAIGRAITRLTGIGGTIKMHGLCASSAVLSVPAGVNLEGDGRGAGNPLGFVSTGTALHFLGAYAGADSKFIELAGRGCHISELTIDACNKADTAVQTADVVASRWRVDGANIARGLERGLYTLSGSGFLGSSEVYGGFRGIPVTISGDNIIGDGNYIFGSGDTKENVRALNIFDDFSVGKSHIYKGGWGVTLSTVSGPNIHIEQTSTTSRAAGNIVGTTFDTAYGPHIQITITNTQAVKSISGLAIVGCNFYQPDSGWQDDTHSCIKISVGSSGTNHVSLKGLTVQGNVGKGYLATSKAYKAFVEVVLLATYGHIYGSSVQGNTIDNCNLGYTGSWSEGGTPGTTAPDVGANLNIRIAGVTDTATAF